MLIEKIANKINNKNVVSTNEIPSNDNPKNINEITKGSLLSNFETSHPEATVPNKALSGIMSKIEPNWASFKVNKSFIVGILDAHEAKHNPDKKK